MVGTERIEEIDKDTAVDFFELDSECLGFLDFVDRMIDNNPQDLDDTTDKDLDGTEKMMVFAGDTDLHFDDKADNLAYHTAVGSQFVTGDL
ncbi:Protein of unknown function [Cotesia congregata]|uniref:Uncharacterized protein n=1 Tax=Cotesia congregata TaxID=51543 RepID=A0A8J2HDH6_COTCN|nr:Protein of unknown function [Cotesia congregata]